MSIFGQLCEYDFMHFKLYFSELHITSHILPQFADDMLIKLWDWEKKWTCTQVFEGHTHYVMQIVINPKDNNTFASASLDRTVKVCYSRTPILKLAFAERQWFGLIFSVT